MGASSAAAAATAPAAQPASRLPRGTARAGFTAGGLLFEQLVDLVLLVIIAVHQVEANLIGLLVMARSVHLPPAVIAIGVVAVGEVFGLLGLIIAVPLLSLTQIRIDVLWVDRG